MKKKDTVSTSLDLEPHQRIYNECKSAFLIFFWKNWMLCAPDQRQEKDHPDWYQQQVQKPDSIMVRGCVSARHLRICGGSIKAVMYIRTDVRAFSNNTAKPDSARVRNEQPRKDVVWVLDCPVCSPDLFTVEQEMLETKEKNCNDNHELLHIFRPVCRKNGTSIKTETLQYQNTRMFCCVVSQLFSVFFYVSDLKW